MPNYDTNKSEIKIFLASSINEFENERNKIGDLVRKMQNELLEKGIRINLFECEFEDNAMVKGRKQEQYNQKLRESDIMILLVGNRVGEFTAEEYEVSKETKEIKRFIFFKNCEADDSVAKFREKLGADVYNSGFKNKIKEYDDEEKLYDEVKKIIIDNVSIINTNNLEKEELKIYNFIFLEGNTDLENDKYAISNFIRNINDKYKKHHVYFNFITNDDITSLTEKDMKDCSGFFIIVGKDIDEKIYEDFDNAYKYFIENESPDLRTFVKKNIKERTQKADEFIKYIGDNLQHYYGEYIDVYRIKYEINNKIDDMKTSNASIEIIDGGICIDGEEIIALDKIPMYSNNEQLIKLKEKFEKIESEYLKLKSSDKTKEGNKLDEITEQYYKYKKDIQDLESQIFNFSKKFSKEAGKNKLTKKQVAAYKCLERGDLDSAKEILNIDDINKDIAHIEAMQESGRKKLDGFVQELISRAETYDLDINNPNRVSEVYASYERAIKVEKDNNLDRNTFLIFADFCINQSDYAKAAELLQSYIDWAEYSKTNYEPYLYIKLVKAYGLSCNFEKGKEVIKKLNDIYEKRLKDENNKDLTIYKCEIDVAYADLLYSEWKVKDKNIAEAIKIYMKVIKTLNNDKYSKYDTAVYQIIKSGYGLLNFYAECGIFSKTVKNYFYGIKSWYDNHNFSTKFEDLQEIKADIYYKYANDQFNKVTVRENDYSELIDIYNELITYTKEHLHEKPQLYNSIMFNSFSDLADILEAYGASNQLIALYDTEMDVIKNKIVILPDDVNSLKELEEELVNKKNKAIEIRKERDEKIETIASELKSKYYGIAENYLTEKKYKKAINTYNNAISYIKSFEFEKKLYGRVTRDYFLCEIYSKLAEIESQDNKPKNAIKYYEKCESIQETFKKIGFEKYKAGDCEIFQYKILQEMIKARQINEAIKFRENALKNIGIEISKNLASDELLRLGIDFADKQLSDILKVKEQKISDFVPNNSQVYCGEIQAKFVDLNDNPLVGYAVNLYDFEMLIGQTCIGKDGKISYYKVPVGWYRIELIDKDNRDDVLLSKYLYVNGATVTDIKLKYSGKQLNIRLMDDANNPIKGATFEVYDSNEEYVTNAITDENGNAFVNLDYGSYFFLEVNAPIGYLMEKEVYKFTLNNENKALYTTIRNERYKGRFAIQVMDKDNNPKEGVKIRIYDSNKDEIITITTNKNGQAGAKNIPYGTYYYKYVDKEEMHEFIIKENDETVIKKVNE